MRKIATCFCLLFPAMLFGSHLTGGYFTVHQISENEFSAEVVVYRDCFNSGVTFDNDWYISVYDRETNTLLDELGFEIALTEQFKEPINYASCNAISYCRAVGIYQGDFELPVNSGGYYLSKERCCRNQESINVDSYSSGMIFTIEIPNPEIINSTPTLINVDANPIACLNQATDLDYGAFDSDGDSLVYKLATPLMGIATDSMASPPIASPKPYSLLNWASGFSQESPMGQLNEIDLNSETGMITVLPNQIGVFTLAIEIEEYRNGTKLGSILYEFQLLVSPCIANHEPILITDPPEEVQTLSLNELYCMDIEITDQNSDDIISIEGSGIFFENLDEFNFDLSTESGSGEASAQFCWIPNENQEEGNSYELEIIISTYGCSIDTLQYSFFRNFLVDNSMSISNNNTANKILAYPNPATNSMTVDKKALANSQYFEMIDLLGNVVMTGQLDLERTVLNISALSSGQYILLVIGHNSEILESIRIQKN